MSSRVDDPTKKKIVSIEKGVYCAHCGTFHALAALDGEPVCHICLFSAAKEQDLAWMLHKTKPLALVGSPIKARPDETPTIRIHRLA